MYSPQLEKYRQGDIVQYMNNVLEIVSESRATDLELVPQRETLANTMQQYNALWQPHKGSELTPQIAELDQRRDELLMGLKTTVATWATYHYKAGFKNASFVIADLINSYGERLVKLRYQQETATITAIVNDLESTLKKEVTLLGLTDWVSELKATNIAFNQKYMERTLALSTEQEGVMASLRLQAIAAFRSLKALFLARKAVAEADTGTQVALFNTVAKEWQQLTEQYNQAVVRLASEKDSKSPSEGEGAS